LFKNVDEALRAEPVPVEKTAVGRHTLNMIDYFLEQTGGKLPLSLCDSQSPLNIASSLVPVDNLLMDLYINPEAVMNLFDRIAERLTEFYLLQW